MLNFCRNFVFFIRKMIESNGCLALFMFALETSNTTFLMTKCHFKSTLFDTKKQMHESSLASFIFIIIKNESFLFLNHKTMFNQ
jgi:hypothetical protein